MLRNAENINTILRSIKQNSSADFRDLSASALERVADVAAMQAPIVSGKGGPVRAYVIYRREQPQGGGAFGSWKQPGMTREPIALLSNQLQRREGECRVIAVSSAGISIPSNTASVVL